METINRKEYPQLDFLLWDIHGDAITPIKAFETYEERWRWVDETALQPNERALLNKLIEQLGGGIFLHS